MAINLEFTDGPMREIAEALHTADPYADDNYHGVWPEHPSDDGKRDGGYIRIMPAGRVDLTKNNK